MTEDSNPAEWVTTKDAAELNGYHSVHIRKATSRGRLDAQKVGRDWLLRKEDVLEYADRMKELGPAKHYPWSLIPGSPADPKSPTKQR